MVVPALLLFAPEAVSVAPLTVATPMVFVQAAADRPASTAACRGPAVLTFAATAGAFALLRGLL